MGRWCLACDGMWAPGANGTAFTTRPPVPPRRARRLPAGARLRALQPAKALEGATIVGLSASDVRAAGGSDTRAAESDCVPAQAARTAERTGCCGVRDAGGYAVQCGDAGQEVDRRRAACRGEMCQRLQVSQPQHGYCLIEHAERPASPGGKILTL